VTQWTSLSSTLKTFVLFFYAKNVNLGPSSSKDMHNNVHATPANADWLHTTNVLFTQLATLHPRLYFAKIDAEAVPALSTEFGLAVVPTFLVCFGPKVLERIEGMKVAELAQAIDRASKRVVRIMQHTN
jgi:hypothetical protein